MRIALCNEVLGAMPLERQCELAAALGYDGLEIAPFTLAEAPQRIDDRARPRGSAASSKPSGLVVTGLHWLLVKPAGLSLTDPDAAVRARTLDVMTRLIGLCAELGGSVLVHGSPKQRAIAAGETHATAVARAASIPCRTPRRVAARARRHLLHRAAGRAETALINTVAEAAELVRAIDQPGLRTMIDCSAAGQTEAQPVPDLIDTLAADRPDRACAGQRPEPARPGPGRDEVRADLRGAEAQRLRRGTVAVEPFDYVPDGPGAAAFAAGYLRGIRESLA